MPTADTDIISVQTGKPNRQLLVTLTVQASKQEKATAGSTGSIIPDTNVDFHFYLSQV